MLGWPYGNPGLLCVNDPALLEWILSVLWNADNILRKTFIPAVFTVDPVIRTIFKPVFESIKIQIWLLLAILIFISNYAVFRECDFSFLFKIYFKESKLKGETKQDPEHTGQGE